MGLLDVANVAKLKQAAVNAITCILLNQRLLLEAAAQQLELQDLKMADKAQARIAATDKEIEALKRL